MNIPASDVSRSVRAMGVSFALGALATATVVHGQERVVYADAHAAPGGDGTSWARAFRDLQDALAAANHDPNQAIFGGVVRIAQGVYTPDRGTLDRSASFPLVSGTILIGGFAGALGADPDERDPDRFVSVLSGDLLHNDGPDFANSADNSRTILDVSNSDLNILDGITISGGNADWPGKGGVIAGNRSNAGMYAAGGEVVLNQCVVRANQAVGQNTIISGGAPTVLLRTRVLGNATNGAPLVAGFGVLAVRCEFRGNSVTTLLDSTSNGPVLNRCLFADNVVTGSALVRTTSTQPLTVSFCTFVEALTPLKPAIWVQYNQRAAIRSCIFAPGGGPPYASAIQHIVANDAALLDVDRSDLLSNGESGIVSFNGGPFPPGTVRSGDPRFVAPLGADGNASAWQDNDYHLGADSPAIDAGGTSSDTSSWLSGRVDLDGNEWYDDPNTPNQGLGPITYADIGCYEFTRRLCQADFNGSGSVTPADIFDFLTAWFALDPQTDYDGDGSVAPMDIFAFLSVWFAGC